MGGKNTPPKKGVFPVVGSKKQVDICNNKTLEIYLKYIPDQQAYYRLL
jgi:hypothetical protein